jgi:hypothetical protein
MQNISRLRAAAGTGEIIRIRYHGGTTPGTIRDLQPVIVDDELVKGLCLASSMFKTFRLDKLEVVSDAVALTYDAGPSPARRFATIGDLAPQIVPLISRPDRHVAVTPISIAVYRLRKKDRKPVANADHELQLTDNYKNPWVVLGEGGRAYGSLDRAAEKFLAALKVTPPWPVEKPKRRPKVFDVGAMGGNVYRPEDDAGYPVNVGNVRPTYLDLDALGRNVYRPQFETGDAEGQTAVTVEPGDAGAPAAEQQVAANRRAAPRGNGLLGRLTSWLRVK